MPLPSEWTTNNEALSKLSVSNDATWKSYHEFRKSLSEQNGNLDDDDDDDSEGHGVLLQRCQEAYRDVIEDLNQSSSPQWLAHTKQSIEDCSWEDVDE